MPLDCAMPEATWQARLALAFERRGERSVLATREHDGPLVVQKPLHPEGPDVCHAIVVHPPAGIAAGDRLVMDITARERSHALLTTPGAAKWYRSAGAWARQHVSIDACAQSHVEWLPQETIVFDGARADIRWDARLEGDAKLIAWDIVRLGRTASGERFARGELRSTSRLWRHGRLAWVERARIGGDALVSRSAAGLRGEAVYATLVCAAQVGDEILARCRALKAPSGEGAVTRLPQLTLARFVGSSTEAVRDYFFSLWSLLRPAVMDCEAVAPRIWST